MANGLWDHEAGQAILGRHLIHMLTFKRKPGCYGHLWSKLRGEQSILPGLVTGKWLGFDPPGEGGSSALVHRNPAELVGGYRHWRAQHLSEFARGPQRGEIFETKTCVERSGISTRKLIQDLCTSAPSLGGAAGRDGSEPRHPKAMKLGNLERIAERNMTFEVSLSLPAPRMAGTAADVTPAVARHRPREPSEPIAGRRKHIGMPLTTDRSTLRQLGWILQGVFKGDSKDPFSLFHFSCIKINQDSDLLLGRATLDFQQRSHLTKALSAPLRAAAKKGPAFRSPRLSLEPACHEAG